MSKSKFTKQQLIDTVQTSINDIFGTTISKRNARNVFNAVLTVIVDSVVDLEDKENFSIPGFGTFFKKSRKFVVRPGLVGVKNLDKPMEVTRKVVTFKPSKMLKDRIK